MFDSLTGEDFKADVAEFTRVIRIIVNCFDAAVKFSKFYVKKWETFILFQQQLLKSSLFFEFIFQQHFTQIIPLFREFSRYSRQRLNGSQTHWKSSQETVLIANSSRF